MKFCRPSFLNHTIETAVGLPQSLNALNAIHPNDDSQFKQYQGNFVRKAEYNSVISDAMFFEVLNIAASLFNGAQAHLKLRDVQVAPEPVTEDVVAFLRGAAHRQDLRVEVPGYGTGALAVLDEL